MVPVMLIMLVLPVLEGGLVDSVAGFFFTLPSQFSRML
jgi:hypothetical protein